MPLEGLRWSRDSGSALYDTPQNGRSRTGWGENFRNFLVERNILVRYFADFINVKSTIKQHFIHKHHSRRFTIIFERK